MEPTIFPKEKAEVCLALADLQITLGKLDEAEKSLSQVPPSHPHLYAALSRIAQSRGDSLQADFYHKSYLHHLSVLRQKKDQRLGRIVASFQPDLSGFPGTAEKENTKVERTGMAHVLPDQNGSSPFYCRHAPLLHEPGDFDAPRTPVPENHR